MAGEIVRYYFWHWDEPRGDEYSDWGESDWYFEISGDDSYSRVIQIYKSGQALLYSLSHLEDQYGILPEGRFGPVENGEKEITKQEFQGILNSTDFINTPKSI